MSKWAYSFNGEDFTAGYDSKEEAINDAVEATAQLPFPNEHIYVGECEEPELNWTDQAENIIYSIRDYLNDEYGSDYVEYFEDQITREDEAGLDERVNAAIDGWIKDYNIKAGFFKVINDEKVDVTDKIKAIRAKEEDTDDDGEMGV